MKLSRTKARSRLAANMPKGSPSIHYMRRMGDGLFAFRQAEKAILTTADDELPTVIGECEADHLESIPPAMAAWLEETAREVADYQAKPKPRGIKNTQIYHETWGDDYVATICPFVTMRNTLEKELGLSIHGNTVKLKKFNIAPQSFIRICGSYDETNGNTGQVRDVNIYANKFYLVSDDLFGMTPILFSNTHFNNISIEENYIEGRNSNPSLGFIRVNTTKSAKNVRIRRNVLHSNDSSNITHIASFRDGGTYSDVFIEGNISNYTLFTSNGDVDNLHVSDNTVIS